MSKKSGLCGVRIANVESRDDIIDSWKDFSCVVFLYDPVIICVSVSTFRLVILESSNMMDETEITE